MEKTIELNSYNSVPRKGISWRAIIAGVITVLSVLLVLNLLGMAFGFGTIDPAEENNPLSGLGTGSLIWWIVSNLIALFAGGFVAARVGVSFYNKSGIIQGIMTWALYTIISAWLLTSAVGSIISGVGNTISDVLSGSGQQTKNTQNTTVVQQQNEQLNLSLEQAKQRFYSLLEDTDKAALDPDKIESKVDKVVSNAKAQAKDALMQPGSIDAEIEQIFNNAKNVFENTFEAVDKQALVNILVDRTNMSESEASKTVENYLSGYDNLLAKSEKFLEKVKMEAQQVAGGISQAIADAAIYLCIALVLGCIVAAAGGFVGVKNLRDDYESSNYIHDTDRESYRTR